MTISSIGNAPAAAAQRMPETNEVKKAGPDHDGDSDDRGGNQAIKTPPAPVVNTDGQTIGQIITAKA